MKVQTREDALRAIEEAREKRWKDIQEGRYASMETMMDDEEPREVEWGTSQKDGFEAFSHY